MYLDIPGRGRSKGNVRSDHVLQDLVYKLVPQLFAGESLCNVCMLCNLLNRTYSRSDGLTRDIRAFSFVRLPVEIFWSLATVC